MGMIECDRERRRQSLFSRCLAGKIKGKQESSRGTCSEEGEGEMGNRKRGQTGGKSSSPVIQPQRAGQSAKQLQGDGQYIVPFVP